MSDYKILVYGLKEHSLSSGEEFYYIIREARERIEDGFDVYYSSWW